jgi:UDP-N-acetyl-D-glucosamine dehydrogenase
MRGHASLHGRRGVSWEEALVGGYDAALIVTDHDGIDYAPLGQALPLAETPAKERARAAP